MGEVTALLLDERKYTNPLREKTLYKLLYFADKELETVGIDTDTKHFWYKFGTMAKTANTPVTVEKTGRGSNVVCSLDVNSINLPEDVQTKARLAISRTLVQSYELGTEGLTDLMYEEAPYEVQRRYRYLDKQLSDPIPDRPDYDELESDPDSIRETVLDIIDAFPEEDFPDLADDLYLWYSVVSPEIDSDEFEHNRILTISELFWTIFCIQLAQRENTGMSEEELAEELDVSDLDEKKENLRDKLKVRERERIMLKRDLEEDEVVSKAADAVAISMLDMAVAD